jgi:outer membrane protein TolC
MKSIGLQVRLAALCASIAVAAEAAGASPADERLVQALRHEVEAEPADLASRLDKPLGLEECIQMALARNVQLDIARQARDAAHTDIGAQYGAFLPVMTATSTRTSSETVLASVSEATRSNASVGVRQRLPFGTVVEAGYSYDKAGTDVRGAEGPSFSLTQPLLRSGGWRTATSGVRDAHLAAESEDVGLRSTILQVVFDVKSAYYDTIRRRKLIDVNKQAVQRDEELLAFSQAKVEAQLATTRDVLSAEIILAQDRGRLVTAEAQYEAALDRLSNVLGLRIARHVQIEDQDVELEPVEIQEETWVAKALRDNPSVQRARLGLVRDELAKNVAGNNRLPQLDLQVAYDEVRASITEDPLAPFQVQPRERSWQGSVTLSYPLFNKPLGNAYRKSVLRYEQGRRLALEAERSVTLQVRDTVRNLQRTEDRLGILEKNIEGARNKLEYARVNFQLGRASNLDITEAQKDLLDAEIDAVNELVNYRVEFARLEQLLGGSVQ